VFRAFEQIKASMKELRNLVSGVSEKAEEDSGRVRTEAERVKQIAREAENNIANLMETAEGIARVAEKIRELEAKLGNFKV